MPCCIGAPLLVIEGSDGAREWTLLAATDAVVDVLMKEFGPDWTARFLDGYEVLNINQGTCVHACV